MPKTWICDVGLSRSLTKLGVSLLERAGLVVVVGLSLTSCSSAASKPATNASVPATVAGNDVYAVPKTITAQYVQIVLNELDKAQLPATVQAYRTGHLSPTSLAIVKSIYTGSNYPSTVAQLAHPSRQAMQALRSHPAPFRNTALKLLTAGPTCVDVQVMRDISPEFRNEPSSTAYMTLVPATKLRDPAYNPTPWMISSFSYYGNPNPCG